MWQLETCLCITFKLHCSILTHFDQGKYVSFNHEPQHPWFYNHENVFNRDWLYFLGWYDVLFVLVTYAVALWYLCRGKRFCLKPCFNFWLRRWASAAVFLETLNEKEATMHVFGISTKTVGLAVIIPQ